MKKFFAHAALAAAALFSVGAANAYVIDFENLDLSGASGAPFLFDGDHVQQGPFAIGAYDPNNVPNPPNGAFVGALGDSSNCIDSICPASVDGTYLASVNDGFVFLYGGGVGMKLSSFDAAFLGPVESNTTAAFLVIEADRSDGTSAAGFFSLDTSFEHYLIGNATLFTDSVGTLTSGNITTFNAYTYYCDSAAGCSLATSNKGQFGLDNISITSVPEPSSWLLMGLGLVGVIAQVRRRRSI